MRFYIASKLENAEQVTEIASALRSAGHENTYDWTTHGSIQGEGKEILKKTMLNELNGVKEADMLIVLFPGGRGSHVELGMGIAFNHTIVLCSDSFDLFQSDDKTCVFYWGENIFQCVGSVNEWISELLSRAKEIDAINERSKS